MNDPGDPIETTAATASQVAVCPRCSTQLRLGRAITDQTPIKCYACQAVFCLAPIDTRPVGISEAPANASPRPMPAPAPALRKSEFSSPPFPLSNHPLEQFVPAAAPAPSAAAAMPRLTSPPMAPTSAAPPLPPPQPVASAAPAAAATTSAAALPKPRRVLQLGPQETMIAGVLIVALVAGGIAGGTLYFHSPANTQDSADPAPDTPSAAATLNASGAALDRPAIVPDWRRTIPKAPSLPPDIEAKTAALVGFWESRSDDGSVSTLELRANESASFLPATDNPSETPMLEGRWSLTAQEGNTATVDIIYTATGLEMHRMTIDLQLPDAMTVVFSAFRGRVERTDQRYVRRKNAPT